MKQLIIVLILIFISTDKLSAQEVSCDNLIDYVIKKGNLKESVFPIQLINSSFLKEVKAYSIDNTIVVIAEYKNSQPSFTTKKYIFCGIPSSNWNDFYIGLSDLGKTFGERFHKYIIDYRCKCD